MPTTQNIVAATFHESPAVTAAVDAIVGELRQAQAAITEVRPPVAERAESYAAALEKFGALKGKGAMYPYVGSGIGTGPLVELLDGSVKWDLINGIGVHMFGHSEPEMVATAVRAAMGDVIMEGNLQFNADAIAFSDLLVSEARQGSRIRHCFLTNSGAMANENALKICMQRKDGKAERILAFEDCFMGRSTTMAQIGDSAGGRSGVPLSTLVDYVPFYDPDDGEASTRRAMRQLERFAQRYPGQHACFVMELIQGEGGFNVAPKSFIQALIDVCKTHDIAVWADEVQTFGRTESMFYFHQLGIAADVDIVTIGKMSQVCAALYTEKLNPRPGLLSGTFIGSSVGLQVGRRALERLRDGGYYGSDGKIARLHRAFREHAAALVDQHPEWFPPVSHMNSEAARFGGHGGMMRLSPFGGDKTRILKLLHDLFEHGVIAFYCGHDPYHLRFLPPVGVMEPEHFEPVFTILKASLARVAEAD